MKVYLYAKNKFNKTDIEVWGIYEGAVGFWFETANITKLPITIFKAKQLQKSYEHKSICFWVEQIN